VRRLAGNVLLALVSSAAFLAALEGAARLLERPRPPRPEVAEYIWDWDHMMPGGFYVMKSDAAGWPPWEEFNRDGLRDRTRTREKPEGYRRIAFLGRQRDPRGGDPAGGGVPAAARGALRGRGASGRGDERRPLGLVDAPAADRVAERIARAYEPDQAVLAVCLNDVPEIFNNLARPPRWLTRLHGSSALARVLVNAEGREIDSVERLFAEPDAPRVREAIGAFPRRGP
jgi:hypothetical protein